MHLIDSHCHLDFPVFRDQLDAVMQQALTAGVADIVVPGVCAADWPRLLSLVEHKHPAMRLHPALGLHPCFMQQHREEDLEQLQQALQAGGICALGEIGLDLFIADADLERQLAFLQPQLALADRFRLPVLLHVRKAHDQMLKQLRRQSLARGGIVHAFSGSAQQAAQYLDLGFRLGIGGTITYERATKLRGLVKTLPLEAFVLETDAPDMPLAAYRDEPNQPARVLQVAQTLADLRGVTLQEVAAQTTATTRQLLGLDQKE
ncbi:TatD family hydrolase [Neptuniibacter halophilus]|uniref:TatD family hydrolase n=1 Tax=Neptuniibacter halophilus TaxID=651666 RepID=UPI00257302D6|nr:TatD family hydrolase [Neptuniibacter halophilus]